MEPSSRPEIQAALLKLDELTRRLRRDCPWDREQDERTIVPHTLEEAYELGDVLFQVHFLALLLEERGAGDLAAVADNTRRKLIRRHPHIFPPDAAETGAELAVDARAVETSDQVLQNWDKIKQGEEGREQGVFAEVPDNLPSLLHARKVQRRAASSGFDFPGVEGPLQSVRDELDELIEVAEAEGERGKDQRFHELGDVLFAAVNVARKLKVDPELALRASSERFRGRVERAAAFAERDGRSWEQLDTDEQLGYYLRARMNEPEPGDRDA